MSLEGKIGLEGDEMKELWWYIHACCQDILVSDLLLVTFQIVFSSRFKLLPSLIVCGDLVLTACICSLHFEMTPSHIILTSSAVCLVTEEEMERVCKFVKIIQFAKTLLSDSRFSRLKVLGK